MISLVLTPSKSMMRALCKELRSLLEGGEDAGARVAEDQGDIL